MNRQFLCVAAATLFSLGAIAETYYVDRSRPNDDGDGKTEATAKRTIQAAVDQAGDGDTVVLLPGVYDEGSVKSGDATSLDTRVMITNRITLTGRDGKDRTFVQGEFSTAAATGVGAGAMRCITIGKGGAGTIVERVTLCGGATLAAGSAEDVRGGAISVDANVGKDAYLCDAVVSNCVGQTEGGGMYRGTAVCCRFLANRCPGQGGGTAAAGTDLSNCIIARNFNYYAISLPATIVNCTIVDNGTTALYPVFNTRHNHLYNSLVLGNATYNGASQAGSQTYAWIASNSVCQTCMSGKVGWLNTLKNGTPIGETDTLVTNAVYEQCYGPAIGDYRLLPTSQAVGWGDPAHLARVAVPEKYRNRDCDGNPIDVTKATCQAGAIQTVGPTPATGKLVINASNDAMTLANGFPPRETYYTALPQYIYADRPSAQVLLSTRHAADNFLAFYDATNVRWHYPDPKTLTDWVALPPVGEEMLVYSVPPSKTLYVDAARPDDSGDGLSFATAKRTIQAAVDQIATTKNATSLVLVKPGTYDEGGREVRSLMTRVAITNAQAIVRSTGSAADTFIVGGENTRCAYLSAGGCLQGFTITGGRATNATDDSGKGAGLFSSSKSANIAASDCVISNNAGYVGAATYNCSLYRCRVTDNTYAKGGTVIGAYVVSSLLTRNKGTTYYVQTGNALYNCTIDSKGAWQQFASHDNSFFNCLLRNCYVLRPYDNRHLFFGNVLAGNSTYTNVWDKDKTTEVEYSCSYRDFQLASRELLDARPLEGVALDGLGDDFTHGDAWLYQCGDIDGRPLRFVDGKVMPGAAQAYAESVYVTNTLGKVTVTGGNGTTGWNSVADGQTVTVTASDAATRPFLGFRVDGVLQDRSKKSIVLDVTYAGKTVEAVYTTDWYVDANDGNDAWDGQTPATARKTLEKIMEMKFVAGDTVHAAPGVYDRGTMTNGTSFYNKGDGVCDLPSRVVVPWSVRLVADEGPEKTFIVGSAATDSARALGLGPGAVRCATVCSSATLSGFTLTGGHTLDVGDVPPADKDRDDDFNGAGVLGVGGQASLVENCIISNNAAFRGGAVVYATVNRCRIFDCQAASEAAATWVCHINGSYIDHFRTDKPVVQYYRGFNSTTIGPDICDEAGNPKTAVYSSNDGNNPSATPAYNSVFLCKPGATVREVAFNSVFLQDSTYVGTYHTNCQMVATAEGLFDAAAAPIPGSGCPALGFADVARYDFDALGWTDVVGNPRFSNNAMDAGAIQSDWRKRYARVLGGGQTLCPLAATNVHEVVEGVRLETGSLTLSAKNAAKAAGNAAEVSVTVDGTGTLKVLVGDEVFKALTAAESPAAFTVPFATGTEQVTFVYEPGDGDTGSATLNSFRLPQGSLLLVR